jgi:hypothetical protein
MPSISRLGRVARAATLPETRRLLTAAARSRPLRDLAGRAVHDRAGLIRDLRQPRNPREVARAAAGHPAVHELARVGLVLLPVRYTPLGWVVGWVSRKALRRFGSPAAAERATVRSSAAGRGASTG